MGLLTKEVEVVLNGSNINHYENLKYKLPKFLNKQGKLTTPRGTTIVVSVNDLSNNSHVLIEVKCDCPDCKNPYLKPMKWQSYLRYVHEDGKYYCNKCAKKIIWWRKY